jgi:c-di-GMP-related signal transduction protein
MGVVEFNNPVHQIEATLNSFAQHPAVYALQRKYNQDPQTMIDRRCKLNTEMLSNTHEPHDKTTLIERTLSFSDDLLNCSQENRAAMQDALARHEQTNSLVTSVLSIASLFDLTNLEEITPFCLKIINELDLGEQWVVIDEVKGWKEEANRLGN